MKKYLTLCGTDFTKNRRWVWQQLRKDLGIPAGMKEISLEVNLVAAHAEEKEPEKTEYGK